MIKNIEWINYSDCLSETSSKIDLDQIEKCFEIISSAQNTDKTIFTCGNGGSASTASHYVTDWTKMAKEKKSSILKSFCLNDNIGLITAYANDIDYESIFEKQIEIYGNSGDILIVVSGSGNSSNIVNALHAARKRDMKSIAIVGYDGGKAAKICDCLVHIPSFDMQICEDIHLMLGHFIMKRLTDEMVVE